MNNIIEVKNLTKKFNGLTAVDRISFEVKKGEIFGFASLFNFGDVGKTDSVSQAEFRAKDRRRAWKIIIYSVLVGAAVAITAFII